MGCYIQHKTKAHDDRNMQGAHDDRNMQGAHDDRDMQGAHDDRNMQGAHDDRNMQGAHDDRNMQGAHDDKVSSCSLPTWLDAIPHLVHSLPGPMLYPILACMQRGVKIVGDMPIYVGGHSADVWANQKLFELSATGTPLLVSGVPPDAFSETGAWGCWEGGVGRGALGGEC